MTESKRQFGLYIHVPFCIKKCDYCDFFSVPLASKDWLDRYAACAAAEIEQRAISLPDAEVSTIYIGGGTPSLLTGKQLEDIICAVGRNFKVADNVEVSMEANPATLNDVKIREIINAGINRLSLGVQSFSDDDLKVLTRIHNSSDVLKVIEILHARGLKNFNIDLIYGVPGQSIDRWIKNLETAIKCEPRHLSAYLLQLEENIPMARDVVSRKIQLLGEDTEYLMYKQTREYLNENGFEHYEISNFCRQGFECRHNLIYWQACEYIGIGPGAVSFIDGNRFINKPQLEEYLLSLENRSDWPVNTLENMSPFELATDAIILGLRLCKGIDIEQFNNRFNIDIISEYNRSISSGINKGLLELKNGHICLTKQGYFLSNEVLCQFIA